MPRARPASAGPTSTFTAATCMRCWRRAWRPERSHSIIAWPRSTRRRDAIRLAFDNGVTVEADIVIGADGVNSKVREYLLGLEPPRFIGMVGAAGDLPDASAARLQDSGLHQMVGPGPAHPRLLHDQQARRGVCHRRRAQADVGQRRGVAAELARGVVRELRATSTPTCSGSSRSTTDVTVWPIFDRERNDRWSGGRIVLLGDACHPMRPFMAAGGAMAIEDAAILSRCLAQFDEADEAYRWYEATRIDRASATCSVSRSRTAGCAGRPTPTGSICYDPCTAPLDRPA